MIDDLDTWKSTLNALPKVADATWTGTLAAWYAARLAAIETDPNFLIPVGFVFVYPTAAFAAALASIPPINTQVAGVTEFSNAWATALAGLIYPATLAVATGSTGPSPPTPATTFSAVASVIIDPLSIAAGQLKIMELGSAEPTADPDGTLFPEKFRDATLALKIIVTGTNSVAPTPGPLVITAPLI